MAVGKLTYFFNQGRWGWSETWYKTVGTLPDLYRAGLAFADKRAACLAKGCIIEAMRSSLEGVNGDSYMETALGGKLPKTPIVLEADAPWNALLLRAEATSLYRRQVWLRGVPDEDITYDPNTGLFTLAPKQENKYLNLKKAILANAFQIRAHSKDPLLAPRKRNASMSIPVGGEAVDVACEDHGLVVGDNVHIGGVKQTFAPIKMNGNYEVIGVPGLGTYTVSVPNVSIAKLGTFLKYGYTQKRVVIYSDITDLMPIRIAKRNTGRAFFVPRGRRKGTK